MTTNNPTIVWQAPSLDRSQREARNGHQAAVVWLTGLSGSGKSSIAHGVERVLHQAGFQTMVLDGDNIRHGLCADLGFTMADRQENMRRVGEVAKLLMTQGSVVLVAMISPIARAREQVRQWLAADEFIEVYCQCPLEVCKTRDPKGLYAKAEDGLIANFTGISSPYEAPQNPTLLLQTHLESVEESIATLAEFLQNRLRCIGSNPALD